MGAEAAGDAGPVYRAFVSYSHADDRFAGWLHRKLEQHRMPDGSRLAPIFIDRAELAAGPDLSAQVRDALANSAALLVIASPSAKASRWVSQEIELFRDVNPDRPVLTALFAGEPADAFPEALLSHQGRTVEPLAADFREGQDGKRLGLLKIIAGLTGQPLDRLVQRDAQARQRRVMAVTAVALSLVLILSAALITAIRARAEAERQRAEAEGLVEFMLTDLRDKLKGVGRLDVMGAVNQRALSYYGDQKDLSALGSDSLIRRARVIAAMGEDDEALGNPEAALLKYLELHRVTEAQYKARPTDPERIFAHAVSENRLALIYTTLGRGNEVVPHLNASLQLLRSLPTNRREPAWIRLQSLVSGNLCAIGVKNKAVSDATLRDCRDAIAQARQHLVLVPADLSAQYDLVFHMLWLASALDSLGNRPDADKARFEAAQLSEQLVNGDPDNMLWREQRMETAYELAKHALARKDLSGFTRWHQLALTDNEVLISRDPGNKYWSDYKAKIGLLKRGDVK